jgi:voltage-gated potassium channel
MWIAFIGLYKILRRLWREPAFRALIILECLMIGGGMVFYHFVEGWSWLDSVYFCVVTVATVGYGDFSPATPYGRLFTIIYIILGVIMLGIFIQLAGKTAYESLQERVQRRQAAQDLDDLGQNAKL